MRTIPSIVFFLLFLTGYANDAHLHKQDPNEVRVVKTPERTLNEHYQYQLRNQPNWRNFVLQNGTWYAHFNETNGKPHHAFGKPIEVLGAGFVDKAMYFLEYHLSGFGLPVEELVYLTETENAHYHQVFFRQRHEGRDVLFARAHVKFTLDGKVIAFGTDVYDDVSVDAIVLDPSVASNAAMEGLSMQIVDVSASSEIKILPVPDYERKMANYRAVYEVLVRAIDEDRVPANYLTLVDAVNGSVLMRKNLVSNCAAVMPGSSSIEVTDDVSLTQPYANETNSVLPNLEVVQGGSTYYTDANGQLSGLNTGNVTLTLRGLWSEVFTNGNTPSFSATIGAGPNAIDWGSNANSRESSAYYHVNVIHDYMKSKFPSFNGLDSPLETNIDVSGTCNAFYDGSSINFYQSGAGCNSFALVADVVYHEYGHGINDKYYQSQGAFWINGAMGEGYADIWALGITANPVLGLGNSQSLPDDYIRRYDIDPKVYPQDLVGQVHADGEIIAGAWWDLGQNFGDLQQMMDLYAATYDALITGLDGNEGEVYVDILIEALLVDDSPANGGDSDITNGTPNDLAIINAFDAHGITLLSNATLVHAAIDSHDDSDIDINMQVQNDYPWALNDAILSYRLNSETTWTTVGLTNVGGQSYAGTIPAQPNGTIVAYYVALENLNGTLANVQPVAAHLAEPNVPYYILVGYDQNRIEDFDTFQDGGWVEGLPSDNNTTGTWTIDVPIGSFSDDGVMVQTDEDHTPGSGNIACAITGNASSSSAGIGENDVDGGHTTLMTPIFDLTAFTNPAFSYWRYYTNSPPSGANPGADWWQVMITDNGSDWVYVENTKLSDPSFRRVAFRVTDYVDLTDQVRVKFIASDSLRPGQNLDGGSLVEGAVDDLQLWEVAGGAQSGITDISVADFNLYPNPASNDIQLSLELSQTSNVRLEVYSIVGSVVYQRDFGTLPSGVFNQTIALQGIANGMYQFRVLTDHGQTVRRVEVIH